MSLPSTSLRRLQIILHAHGTNTSGKARTDANESNPNVSGGANLYPFAQAVERLNGAEVNVIRLNDSLSTETTPELDNISGRRFQLSGDNPMLAELCSHIGLNSNMFCYRCMVGGTQEHKRSEAGYEELFSVHHIHCYKFFHNIKLSTAGSCKRRQYNTRLGYRTASIGNGRDQH